MRSRLAVDEFSDKLYMATPTSTTTTSTLSCSHAGPPTHTAVPALPPCASVRGLPSLAAPAPTSACREGHTNAAAMSSRPLRRACCCSQSSREPAPIRGRALAALFWVGVAGAADRSGSSCWRSTSASGCTCREGGGGGAVHFMRKHLASDLPFDPSPGSGARRGHPQRRGGGQVVQSRVF